MRKFTPPDREENKLDKHDCEDGEARDSPEEKFAARLSWSVWESGQGDNEEFGNQTDECYAGGCVVAVPEEGEERCKWYAVPSKEDGGFWVRGAMGKIDVWGKRLSV